MADAFAKDISLLDDEMTFKKVKLNYTRNKKQDNTDELEDLAFSFDYTKCKDQY